LKSASGVIGKMRLELQEDPIRVRFGTNDDDDNEEFDEDNSAVLKYYANYKDRWEPRMDFMLHH
jgi:hypothetical protein